MLVYGDRSRTVATRRLLADVEQDLGAGDLIRALLNAGELAQGLADAEVEDLGCDQRTPAQDAAMALATEIARRYFDGSGDATAAARVLAALPLPDIIRCKQPEGYAFYAVYPECYAITARSVDWGAPPVVIGLRSIGTSLAAVVAAVTGGRAISVRPQGHPFAREMRVSDTLKAELRAHEGPFAIVDEGPGLSGSSFGAAADLLDGLGVASERIVFMPSHRGEPGPQASPRHRTRWATARRACRTLDDLLEREPIGDWFADLIGPTLRCEDLSAGAWRSAVPLGAWPPVVVSQERRKFRLTTAEGRHLARFVGLGSIGEPKLARARALAEGGFTPEPLVLRRGFLLERWVDGDPLPPARPGLQDHLARYLTFRARRFPATSQDGAGFEALRDMAVHNTAELCGRERGRLIGERLDRLAPPAADLTPVHVDGRLQPWEWMRLPDGRICKTDALDHSEGHDLVGCQDIAWDVAGAAVEFDLPPGTIADLCAELGVSPAAVAALRLCYAALHAGAWTMALAGADPAEAARIRPRRDIYLRVLHADPE